MGQWVKEDKIHYREEITDGLENAPQTFIGLLKGKNYKLPLKMWFYIFCHREYVINSS